MGVIGQPRRSGSATPRRPDQVDVGGELSRRASRPSETIAFEPSHPSENGAVRGRLDYIDVLRATAAFAVFAVHIYGYWLDSPVKDARGFTPSSLVIRIMSLGGAGVDLFVVISGFCLAYPLYRGTSRGSAPRSLKTLRFYRRRAFRIFPAYYAAAFLFFGLELIRPLQRHLVAHPVNGWDLIAHLFFVQSWFPATVGAINGPFWSIALEVQLYLVFPLLLWGIRRWGLPTAILALAVVAVVWFGVAHVWYAQPWSHGFGSDLQKQLPARWFEFAFGVGAARLATAPRGSDRWYGYLAVVLGIPVALAAEAANNDLVRTFGWGGLSVGLVIVASFLPHRLYDNRVGRAVRKFGLISFSFYLIHQPAILLLNSEVAKLRLSEMQTVLLGVTVGFGIIVLFAKAFFVVVERPFLVRGGMRDAIVYSNQ